MYQNIIYKDIRWPKQSRHGFEFSLDAKDLIQKLLIKDKSKRFGVYRDAEEILEHNFFN